MTPSRLQIRHEHPGKSRTNHLTGLLLMAFAVLAGNVVNWAHFRPSANGPLADCLLKRNHWAYADIDQLCIAMDAPDPNSETWPINRGAVKKRQSAGAADRPKHYFRSEEWC